MTYRDHENKIIAEDQLNAIADKFTIKKTLQDWYKMQGMVGDWTYYGNRPDVAQVDLVGGKDREENFESWERATGRWKQYTTDGGLLHTFKPDVWSRGHNFGVYME